MDKMNKILAAGEPVVLSIFRIITGLLLFQYGVAKLLKFPAGTMFAKVQALSLFPEAGMFVLDLDVLLFLGLFSRLGAVIPASANALAYFLDRFTPNFISPA